MKMPNRNKRKKTLFKRIGNREGLATLEFALVAPAFFIMIFASIEFSRLSMIRNLTQDAAYFAARHAMVPGATSAEAIDEANRILGFMNTKGAVISINENEELDDDTNLVSVTITVPVAENSFLIPKFTNDIEFSATATMRTERYDGYYDPFTVN